MKKLLIILIAVQLKAYGQVESFPSDPSDAKFITSDIPNFWSAFDSVGISVKNPFEYYLKRGSTGVKEFIANRIINADSLLAMVKRRGADYETKRNIEEKIREEEKVVKPYFYKLKELYPKTKFPPVYFVFGRFNSGGTSQPGGLIVGAEMLNDLKGLSTLVIHESIHFQQTFPKDETTLLEQSVLEGAASFIAALITKTGEDSRARDYMALHKDKLFPEFVSRLDSTDKSDWLYGTTKKDDRPNDLGYWMGYKISEAFYIKAEDKKAAIDQILNVKDYQGYLKTSGFLNDYMK